MTLFSNLMFYYYYNFLKKTNAIKFKYKSTVFSYKIIINQIKCKSIKMNLKICKICNIYSVDKIINKNSKQ